MERRVSEFLEASDPSTFFVVLLTLSEASTYLQSRRRAYYSEKSVFLDSDEEAYWEGVSPYFGNEMSDWLCVCLKLAVCSTNDSDELLILLASAVQLEVGDAATLQAACHRLVAGEHCQQATPAVLAEVLHLVSLAMKRSKVPRPPLDHLLCRLVTAELTPRDSLRVLCALVRLKDEHSIEVVRGVSRRAVSHVEHYTAKDVLFALEAVALLGNCSEVFAGAVLDRCTALIPSFTPEELGSTCKYVAILSRCGPADRSDAGLLRRLLPAVIARVGALEKQFSLRDARCILRCLEQHKVRHSVVLSQLTLLVANS